MPLSQQPSPKNLPMSLTSILCFVNCNPYEKINYILCKIWRGPVTYFKTDTVPTLPYNLKNGSPPLDYVKHTYMKCICMYMHKPSLCIHTHTHVHNKCIACVVELSNNSHLAKQYNSLKIPKARYTIIHNMMICQLSTKQQTYSGICLPQI